MKMQTLVRLHDIQHCGAYIVSRQKFGNVQFLIVSSVLFLRSAEPSEFLFESSRQRRRRSRGAHAGGCESQSGIYITFVFSLPRFATYCEYRISS